MMLSPSIYSVNQSNNSMQDQSDFFYASVHVIGIGLMFYGLYITFGFGRIAGLWMALLGLVVFRVIREAYAKSMVASVLHGKAVAEFMDADAVAFDPATPVSEIMSRATFKGARGTDDRLVFPVARATDHELVGLVDVRSSDQIPAREWRIHQVAEITKPCARDLLVAPDEDAESTLQRMQSLGLREVLVVKGGRLLGVLTRNSLMNRIQDRFAMPTGAGIQPAT